MKKFGEGQQPFKAIMDIPEGDAQELTTVTDQALNSLYGELFNLLKAHGINPTTTTSADLKQVARAVYSAVAAGNFYIDSGGSNVKNLTHVKGGNFLFKNTNANDDGFIIEFLNKTQNTGAVVINVFDVENNENHFNNIPLVAQNGSEIQAKVLAANSLVKAYFSKEINKFVLLAVQNTKTTDDNVYNIDGIALRDVALHSVDSVADIANIAKTHGRKIYVASYHTGLNKGGGIFIYDATKSSINDGGVVINGWVRQLDGNRIDPVCFGAKANFTSPSNVSSTFDDALAIQKTVNYLSSVGGGTVVFGSGKYWINSYQRADTSDSINVIDMQSDVSFEWINSSQFIIGNYFDDKPFHIFSGLTAGGSLKRNIHFINPYITSIPSQNHLKTRYTRRVCIEFGLCENVSVSGGIIRDIDLSNAINVGAPNTTSLYAKIYDMKFLNLVYGDINSANVDHTTVYLLAQQSSVYNCEFSIVNGEKGWRIACPCEIHDSYSTFRDSTVFGYTRGGWFVAERDGVSIGMRISNITGVIANAGIYIWISEDAQLTDCVADNNVFYCYHPISDDVPFYYGYQGLFSKSGNATSGTAKGIVFKDNTVFYLKSTLNEYRLAWCVGYDNYDDFTIVNNTFEGITGGLLATYDEFIPNDYKNWKVVGNTFNVPFLTALTTTTLFNIVTSDKLTNFVFEDNKFNFVYEVPDYIVTLQFPNTSEKVKLGEIRGVEQIHPKIADYNYPSKVATDPLNFISNTFYGLTFNVPAIDVGKYAVVQPTMQPTIAIPYRSTASFIAPWPAEVSVEANIRVISGAIKAIIKNATVDNISSPQVEIGGVICKVVGYA